MLKDIWRFLWAPFAWDQEPRPRDLEEALTPVDVEDVIEKFDLARSAERYGSQDLPATDDSALDSPQQKIRQYMEDRIAEAYRLASHERAQLFDAIRGRDISTLVARARSLPKIIKNEVTRDLRRASRNLQQLNSERQSVVGRIRSYQENYDIDRRPDLRDASERRTLITFTLILALVQAGANGLFFAEGMRFGLSMGLGVAILLGWFDVAVHTLVIGRQAVKIKAPDLPNRLIGGMSTMAFFMTVPGWNLGLVHLRLTVHEQGFDRGIELWGERFFADVIGFSDFMSFALLGVGLLCSGLAVATGWNWDEPIPLFRKEGRRLQEIEKEIAYWKDARSSAVEEAERRGREELEKIGERVDHNVGIVQHLFEKIATLRESVFLFTDKMEHAYRAVIRFYRDENRMARSSPPPEYFGEDPHIEFERALELDLDEPRTFAQEQVALKNRFLDEQSQIREALEQLAGPTDGVTG